MPYPVERVLADADGIEAYSVLVDLDRIVIRRVDEDAPVVATFDTAMEVRSLAFALYAAAIRAEQRDLSNAEAAAAARRATRAARRPAPIETGDPS